jgi:hypothetical protein
MSLTRLQRGTISALKAGDYSNITQTKITQLLKAFIDNEDIMRDIFEPMVVWKMTKSKISQEESIKFLKTKVTKSYKGNFDQVTRDSFPTKLEGPPELTEQEKHREAFMEAGIFTPEPTFEDALDHLSLEQMRKLYYEVWLKAYDDGKDISKYPQPKPQLMSSGGESLLNPAVIEGIVDMLAGAVGLAGEAMGGGVESIETKEEKKEYSDAAAAIRRIAPEDILREMGVNQPVDDPPGERPTNIGNPIPLQYLKSAKAPKGSLSMTKRWNKNTKKVYRTVLVSTLNRLMTHKRGGLTINRRGIDVISLLFTGHPELQTEIIHAFNRNGISLSTQSDHTSEAEGIVEFVMNSKGGIPIALNNEVTTIFMTYLQTNPDTSMLTTYGDHFDNLTTAGSTGYVAGPSPDVRQQIENIPTNMLNEISVQLQGLGIPVERSLEYFKSLFRDYLVDEAKFITQEDDQKEGQRLATNRMMATLSGTIQDLYTNRSSTKFDLEKFRKMLGSIMKTFFEEMRKPPPDPIELVRMMKEVVKDFRTQEEKDNDSDRKGRKRLLNELADAGVQLTDEEKSGDSIERLVGRLVGEALSPPEIRSSENLRAEIIRQSQIADPRMLSFNDIDIEYDDSDPDDPDDPGSNVRISWRGLRRRIRLKVLIATLVGLGASIGTITEIIENAKDSVDEVVSGDTATKIKNLIPSADESGRPSFKGEKHAVIRLPDSKLTGIANYLGPGTSLLERLRRRDPPRSKVDEVAKKHDILYALATSIDDIRRADEEMLAELAQIKADGSDYPFNIAIGEKLIKLKVKAEDLGVLKRTAFSGDFSENISGEDRSILESNLSELNGDLSETIIPKNKNEDIDKNNMSDKIPQMDISPYGANKIVLTDEMRKNGLEKVVGVYNGYIDDYNKAVKGGDSVSIEKYKTRVFEGWNDINEFVPEETPVPDSTNGQTIPRDRGDLNFTYSDELLDVLNINAADLKELSRAGRGDVNDMAFNKFNKMVRHYNDSTGSDKIQTGVALRSMYLDKLKSKITPSTGYKSKFTLSDEVKTRDLMKNAQSNYNSILASIEAGGNGYNINDLYTRLEENRSLFLKTKDKYLYEQNQNKLGANPTSMLDDYDYEKLPKSQEDTLKFRQLQAVEKAVKSNPEAYSDYTSWLESATNANELSPAEYYDGRLLLLKETARQHDLTDLYDKALTDLEDGEEHVVEFDRPQDSTGIQSMGEDAEGVEHEWRSDIIDPAEAKLFLSDAREVQEEKKRWDEYSMVMPGHGLGTPSTNGLIRQNMRDHQKRFSNNYKTGDKLKPYGPQHPCRVPTKSSVDRRSHGNANQTQFYNIYQSDDIFEDAFENASMQHFTAPYPRSNKFSAWENSRSNFHPDSCQYNAPKRHAVTIPEIRNSGAYFGAPSGYVPSRQGGVRTDQQNAMYGYPRYGLETANNSDFHKKPVFQTIKRDTSGCLPKGGSTRM